MLFRSAFSLEPANHITRTTWTITQPYTAYLGDAPQAQEIQCDIARTGPLIDINGDFVTLRNLWFSDVASATTVRVSGGTQVRIENCVFDVADLAIEVMDGVSDVSVVECVFVGGTRAVHLRGTGARHRVAGCRFVASPVLPDASIYADDAITDSLYDENIAAGAASSLLSVKALTGYSIGTAIGTVTVRP